MTIKTPILEKKKWKKIEPKSLIMTTNLLSFTDDEKDIVSNDFHFEKVKKMEKESVVKKKKPKTELEKPEESTIYDLTTQQKEIVQKNTIIKERLLAIDKILELYPNLKKDKTSIVNKVLGKQEVQKKDYVVEKLDVYNKTIYKDTFGNLMDANVNLVGFWSEITDPNNNINVVYHFFDDIKKIKTKLARNKKKINMAYIDNIKNKKKLENNK